jgi:hypothetical protein
VVTGIGIVPMFAQEGTKPAPVLSIGRESIKEGRTAAHEKVEADYAATFRKANFPGHYIAMATISGANEVWFIQPMASFVANEDFEKATDKEPLKSALALMDSRDGELRTTSRTIWAVYRPDLSYKPETFNPAKSHFVEVGTFRVRLGRSDDFAQGAKAYFGGFAKANVDLCILGYEITAGAPSGTYLFFTPMDSMKVLDGDAGRAKAVREGPRQEGFAQLMKGLGDVVLSIEHTLLEVKPGMSYPSQAMIDADPGFWKPKPAMKPMAAAAPPEKKAAQ